VALTPLEGLKSSLNMFVGALVLAEAAGSMRTFWVRGSERGGR